MTRTPLRPSVCLSVLVLVSVAIPVAAGEIHLSWNPSTGATGYRVHRGTATGNYTISSDAGPTTSTTITDLADCVTSYFAVTAYNTAGESGYSEEAASFPRAVVSGAAPSNIERGAQTDITISGLNFRPGEAVTVSNPGVQIGAVTVGACNQMVVTVTVDSDAATGATDLTITHPSGVAVTAAGLLMIEDGSTVEVPPAPTGLQVD